MGVWAEVSYYTPNQLLQAINSHLWMYGELGDVPIEVEHEDGTMATGHIHEVRTGSNCITLIIVDHE